MLVMGIDPGKNGGLAVVGDSGLKVVIDMPLKKTNDYDIEEIYNFISDWSPDVILIEKQHSISRQGVKSIFTTGYGYGVLVGVATIAAVRPVEVAARTWQKYFSGGGNTKWTKQDSLAHCVGMLNLNKNLFSGPKGGLKDGRVDAVLIAFYGYDRRK